MTDHAHASHDALTRASRDAKPNQEANVASREALTHALLAIADAIRGLTPNAAQDAAGCPQIDPQPEPGQLDGHGGAEATGGNWDRNRVAYWEPPADPLASYGLPSRWALGVSEPAPLDGDGATGPAKPRSTMTHLAERDWQEYYETTETMVDLKTRAEEAEADRDHILRELREAVQRMGLRGGVLPTVVITDIIHRHTPEG